MVEKSLPRFCIRCGEKLDSLSKDLFCNDCKIKVKEKDISPIKTIPQKDRPIRTFPKKDMGEETIPKDKKELKATETFVSKEWKEGDLILNLYELKEILGEGGMGIVHKVYHRGWNINLAVKSPKKEAISKAGGMNDFISEAETWVNLDLHPSIVTCYYSRTLGNIPRIFVEYIEGGSLGDWIEENKLTELKDILDVAIQFTWGLAYAHKKGLIHKDIKPANVLMTEDRIVKVTDFGLAKAKGLTKEYCSPEQASDKKLTLKTDIWSFALSILEMFIGERTWIAGEAAPVVLDEYISRNIVIKENIAQMPEELVNLLKKCFQIDINKRPDNMLEISNILINIYKKEIGEEYFRKIPEEVKLRADSLNNKALSLLDIGKIEEAENTWQEALKIDPNHPETTYNMGFLNWRNSKITDLELVEQLESVIENQKNNWHPYYLLGLIHLERGDKNSADKILKKADSLSLEESDINDALANLTKVKDASFLQSFEGHKKYVNAIAVTLDDKCIVSGSSDNTLKLWDIKSGECLRTFVGHEDSIYALAITSDGKYIVSGSDDNTLKLWDINSRDCLRTFVGHKGWVNSVVITTDGQYIISGSNDKTLKLWDLNNGKCLRTFVGHKGWVRDVGITKAVKPVNSTIGKHYIVSGSDDGTLKLWDINNEKCLRTFWGHKYGVGAVAITTDGKYIVSGSSDNTLKLWDTNNGKCLRTFKGHKKVVKDLVITPDSKYIISGSLDNTLRLWDLNSGKCLRTFEGHEDVIHAVAITQDGNFMVSSSRNNRLWLWRLEGIGQIKGIWVLNKPISAIQAIEYTDSIKKQIITAREAITANNIKDAVATIHRMLKVPGSKRDTEVLKLLHQVGIRGGKRVDLIDTRCLHTFYGHTHRVNSIAITLDGYYAISSSSDKTLKLWDLNNLRYMRTFKGHERNVECIAITPNGSYIVSGSDDMTLKQCDLKSRLCLHTFEGHKGWVKGVDITPDGKYAISGSEDNTLKLWDLKSCECIQTLKEHKGSVESVAITPDGQYAVSGSYDKTLKLWNLNNGKCIRTFKGHEDSVRTIAITPDGKYVISGSNDMTLKLWDLNSGKCLRTFVGHKGWVKGVDITPDGKYVISGSWDNTLKIWNVNSGECLRTLEEHKRSIYTVSITSDGRYMLSGSSDKTLKLWQLNWDYEFPEEADWDEGAKPYLEIFLTLHTPYSPDRIKRVGKPIYTEEDFKKLLKDLGYRGYGWLKQEKVRQKLKEMIQKWEGQPDWYESDQKETPPPNGSEYEMEVMRLEKLIEKKREADDIDGVARAYYDLGNLHYKNKKYTQAKAIFEKVLAIYEEIGDKKWMGTCYVMLGIVNMYQGNYNQAEILYNKALTLSEETNYGYLTTLCYHNLGVLYDIYLKQPQDALQMYKACLRLYKELEMPIPKWLEAAIQRLSKERKI